MSDSICVCGEITRVVSCICCAKIGCKKCIRYKYDFRTGVRRTFCDKCYRYIKAQKCQCYELCEGKVALHKKFEHCMYNCCRRFNKSVS